MEELAQKIKEALELLKQNRDIREITVRDVAGNIARVVSPHSHINS